jgi:phosphatidylglycerol:prolipoprotein diacylglycerol transferase
MIPIREGFALNLSFLHISDFIVLILALLAAGFGLIPEKRVKNPWGRTIIYVVGALLLILIFRLVLPAGNVLANAMGTILVHWYGVLIMTGVILAAFIAAWGAKRRRMDPNFIWDMLPWLLIAGIVGARIWHILTPPQSMIEMGITTQYYLTHPLDAIAIWNGGLGIPGAVIGGVVALLIYCLVKKQKFSFWVDVIAPGLLAAQIIGRIGNFLNQELYGKPSTLPWAIFIDPAKRLPQYINVATYHPLFAYEMLWNLINLAIILYLTIKVAKKLIDGDIFLFYLMLYAIARFSLEFLRLDYSPVAGININQTLMVVVFAFAVILFILKHTVFLKRLGLGLTDYHEVSKKEKIAVPPAEKKKATTSKPVLKKEEMAAKPAKTKTESKKTVPAKKK